MIIPDTLLPYLLLQTLGLAVQDVLLGGLDRLSGRATRACLVSHYGSPTPAVRLRVTVGTNKAGEPCRVRVDPSNGEELGPDTCEVVVPQGADTNEIVLLAVLPVQEWWSCRQAVARAQAGMGEIATHDTAAFDRLAELPATGYLSQFNSAWLRHDAMLRTAASIERDLCRSIHAALFRRAAASGSRACTDAEIEAAQAWAESLSPAWVGILDDPGCDRVDDRERLALMRRQERDKSRYEALVAVLDVTRLEAGARPPRAPRPRRRPATGQTLVPNNPGPDGSGGGEGARKRCRSDDPTRPTESEPSLETRSDPLAAAPATSDAPVDLRPLVDGRRVDVGLWVDDHVLVAEQEIGQFAAHGKQGELHEHVARTLDRRSGRDDVRRGLANSGARDVVAHCAECARSCGRCERRASRSSVVIARISSQTRQAVTCTLNDLPDRRCCTTLWLVIA